MIPLKYLSNFWITLDVPLINCEINISLTWSDKCIIVTRYYGDQEPKLAIIDAKHLCSSCGFISLRLRTIAAVKIGFKRTINWNKYQSEPTAQRRNRYLNHIIDPSFQEVNRLFISSVENDGH